MAIHSYIAAFTGNIVAFVSGQALTWSSPELGKFNSSADNPFDHELSDEETSWISSFMALGAVFGPFLFGFLADKIGRKITLLSIGIPFIISYILMTFVQVVEVFDVARFLIGMGVGGTFTILPMYIGEVSENSNRGALSSSMNCFICLGLLSSYCVGPYTSVTVFNGILIVFPCLFLVLMFLFGPESPHYYVAKNEMEKASFTLKKIRGGVDVKSELYEIQQSIEEAGNGSFTDLFKSKALIKACIISLSLVVFQQMSGINAVLFYSENIFEAANTGIESALCSIIIGLTQFLTSFITPVLADHLGRRLLLIISAIGMLISEIPLGIFFILKDNGNDVDSISFLPILCLVAYIFTYNVGFGPLPWAIMGEIFPPHVKSIASSTTASVCWFIGFLVAKFFNQVQGAIGIGTCFLIFAGFCAAAFLFSIFYLFETKGKSLVEIQKELEK